MEMSDTQFIIKKFLKDCHERNLPLPFRICSYEDGLCQKNPEKYLFTILCLHEHFETAKFMYEMYHVLFDDIPIYYDMPYIYSSHKLNNIVSAFITCSEKNNINACQFLYPYLSFEQFIIVLFQYIELEYFKRAIDKNLLIDWFLSKKECKYVIDALFLKSCENDRTLFIAKKIYNLYKIKNITIKETLVSDCMIFYNKTKVLDWLINEIHVFSIIESHKNDEQFNLTQREKKYICEYLAEKKYIEKHTMFLMGFCFGGQQSLLCGKCPICCFKFTLDSLL
jgi:hypothetical protein